MGKLFTEHFAFGEADSVVVIGLGRFGGAVAQSLMSLGHEVLGIDRDATVVQAWADRLTHAVQCDATDTMAMRQLGVADFRHGIVGIGDELSASLMTQMALHELQLPDIWVKAMNEDHGRLAQRIGAHHVVYPEADMGERVAHLISGRMIDFIELDDGFAIAKVHAPAALVGKTLAEAGVRETSGVTVIGWKRPRQDFEYAVPDSRVQAGDLLIVCGQTRKVEAFGGQHRR